MTARMASGVVEKFLAQEHYINGFYGSGAVATTPEEVAALDNIEAMHDLLKQYKTPGERVVYRWATFLGDERQSGHILDSTRRFALVSPDEVSPEGADGELMVITLGVGTGCVEHIRKDGTTAIILGPGLFVCSLVHKGAPRYRFCEHMRWTI